MVSRGLRLGLAAGLVCLLGGAPSVNALEPGAPVYKVGDRVTAEAPAHLCGTCDFCRVGNYNLCSNRLGLGWGVNGAFAKYVVIEENMTHKIPDNISYKAGALLEPLACVCHGMELTEISADQVVLVADATGGYG